MRTLLEKNHIVEVVPGKKDHFKKAPVSPRSLMVGPLLIHGVLSITSNTLLLSGSLEYFLFLKIIRVSHVIRILLGRIKTNDFYLTNGGLLLHGFSFVVPHILARYVFFVYSNH